MHTWRTQEEETLPRFLDVPTYKIQPEHTLLLYYKPTAWKRKLKHQDRANVHKRWRSAGVWREREGRYWSAVGHEGRIHCVLLLTQTIDHHKETIFTKWVQFPGSSWKIRVACAVCSLQPAGRDHCVLLRAPRKLLTIPRKRSSLSGLNTRGFEGGGPRSWKIWVAYAVCFLKPEGCTHCFVLRAPRRLLTITRKRSSLSGLNTRGWGSSWKIRVACAGGGGVFRKIQRGICVVLS